MLIFYRDNKIKIIIICSIRYLSRCNINCLDLDFLWKKKHKTGLNTSSGRLCYDGNSGDEYTIYAIII